MELEDVKKTLEKATINHRKVYVDATELKHLRENVLGLLQIWEDENLCCCDGPDWSVGIPPITCEAHAIAWIVADLIEHQKRRK